MALSAAPAGFPARASREVGAGFPGPGSRCLLPASRLPASVDAYYNVWIVAAQVTVDL